MQIAMIGMGKMGGNMAARLLRAGHQLVAFARNQDSVRALVAQGAQGGNDLADVVGKLKQPRAVWVMVPSGDPTEEVLKGLADLLQPGDTIIDGGNANYKDSIRRATWLGELGIDFLDVGTSGGIWGLENGYSLMIGGDQAAVDRLGPIFASLAPAANRGWGRVGPSGAGHFVKMIHNGIEYGMMQAFAEGFEILRAKESFSLDLHRIAEIWQHGSVVRSWLLDLTAAALADDQELKGVEGWVADSGEGRWTIFESIDLDVPAPVISLALQMRFISRQEESYAAKLLAAMRAQFGGHSIRTKVD